MRGEQEVRVHAAQRVRVLVASATLPSVSRQSLSTARKHRSYQLRS